MASSCNQQSLYVSLLMRGFFFPFLNKFPRIEYENIVYFHIIKYDTFGVLQKSHAEIVAYFNCPREQNFVSMVKTITVQLLCFKWICLWLFMLNRVASTRNHLGITCYLKNVILNLYWLTIRRALKIQFYALKKLDFTEHKQFF